MEKEISQQHIPLYIEYDEREARVVVSNIIIAKVYANTDGLSVEIVKPEENEAD